LSTPRSLSGLRVLVTGASSGIGAAVSTLLAARGARVVGTGRSSSALKLAPAGALQAAIVRDLTQPGAPGEVVSAAVSALGGLDVVVSNAGAGWSGPFDTMSPADIDTVLDINLRAPVHLSNAAAPYLLNSEAGGQLVLIGSIVGLVGVAEEVAYGAAKYGLRGLADGLRSEWARDPGGRRVTVTLVSPGVVDTPFFTRRNRAYQRSWPKPMPVAKVARLIVSSIEHRRDDVVVPAWLLLAGRLNGGVPRFYRFLSQIPARTKR
jgi:NAD(P)-dependent dehydrogenase (short-subunit alcohol dehydrogenase family)